MKKISPLLLSQLSAAEVVAPVDFNALFSGLDMGGVDASPFFQSIFLMLSVAFSGGLHMVRHCHLQGLPQLLRRRYLRRALISDSRCPSRSKFKGSARCFRQRWSA